LAGLDPLLLDVMRRCLEKRPEKRASVEELLRHPYVRPVHDGNALPVLGTGTTMVGDKLCPSCKKRQREMARLTKKRLNAFSDLC
jgi:serine/threonine protein kinase